MVGCREGGAGQEEKDDCEDVEFQF